MKYLMHIVVMLAALLLSFPSGAFPAEPKNKTSAGTKAKAAAAAVEQREESAGTLIDEANAAVANGDLDGALTLARKAASLSPANYKAHYYVGFVLFKQNDLDGAHTAVQEALQFAPPEARGDLLKLSQAVKSARAGTEAARLAEAAQAEGLAGKAANLWKQAWEAGYKNAEHGFAAARAYANNLEQPVVAAQIMREIVAKSGDQAAIDKAERVLDQLAPQLSTIAASQFAAAQQASGPARLKLLREVLDADPGFIPAYEMRATAAAENGDLVALKEVLRDMSRRNKLDLAILKRPEFAKMMKDPGMAMWLDDLVGTVAARKLLDEVAGMESQRTQQVRFEGDQKAHQNKLAAYEAQLAEHKKYLPCLEEAQARHQSCEQALPKPKSGLFGMGSNAQVRSAMQAACVRQSKELVAQCQSSYPVDPPVPPPTPTVVAAPTL